uniref:Si:ch1073-416j23.1 n=1 Tax=Cyprinus carpio TaxID=7962 RepID=A0A8C1LMY6_CYPCA
MDSNHPSKNSMIKQMDFEAAQKKWLHAELELKKELLVKSDVAQAALEVKLRHTQNQLNVEIKKRYKAEADYQCLQALHFVLIDESSFLSHSDISYDRTDDDLPEGQIHMVIDITQETPEYQSRTLRNECFPPLTGLYGVCMTDGSAVYIFYMIHPETCMPCGKRIRFGKLAIKCRDCRMVSHPESKQLCLERCSPNAHGSAQLNEETLESFAASTRPWIPSLIVQCVHEIERRGLEEELREKYVSVKGPLMLHKVEEVHAVCGLLKDFLRKLKEPLITFKLHRTFIVAKSLTWQMDRNNLSRVFGPTVIGHGMLEPSPMTIMRDTNTQPKVVAQYLSFPSDFWEGLLAKKDTLMPPAVDSNVASVCPSTSRGMWYPPCVKAHSQQK